MTPAGRIRVLAYNQPKRVSFLPDVPTMREAGVAGIKMDASWHGLFAPAKTPPAVLAQLEAEVRKALALPEVREQFTKLGLNVVGSTAVKFRPFVAAAIACMGEIVRIAGAEAQ